MISFYLMREQLLNPISPTQQQETYRPTAMKRKPLLPVLTAHSLGSAATKNEDSNNPQENGTVEVRGFVNGLQCRRVTGDHSSPLRLRRQINDPLERMAETQHSGIRTVDAGKVFHADGSWARARPAEVATL